MSRHVIVDDEALTELEAAVEYYEQCQAGLGADFYALVLAALDRIASPPDLSTPEPTDSRARRILLQRFPFAVVFFVRGDNADVVAVMDLRRRPGYWRSRRSLRRPGAKPKRPRTRRPRTKR